MWLDKLLLSLCLLDWIDFKNLILAISWNGFPTMSKLLFATCPQRDSKCRQLLLEIQQPFKKSLNEFWSNFHWCSDDELSFIGSLKKVRILFTKNIKSPYTKKIYMIVFFCVCGFFSFFFFFFFLLILTNDPNYFCRNGRNGVHWSWIQYEWSYSRISNVPGKEKNIFFSPWPISLTFGTTQPQNILYFFWLALSQLSGKV